MANTREPRTPIGGASRLLLDGAWTEIDGFESGTYMGDQMPFFINSPVMSLSSAAANQGSYLVPFRATIVKCIANLVQAPAGASGGLNVGTRADPDHFLDLYDFSTGHATGLIDLTDLSQMVNTSIDAGDIVEFDTDGDGTSAGLVAVTLICVPRLA